MPQLASPHSPGPWVEMGRLAVGTYGCGGLSCGWAPRLVSQALLNGHLDELVLAQAAVQAVLLMPNGTLSAPRTDLRGHSPPPLTPAGGTDTRCGARSVKPENPIRRPKPSRSLTFLQNSCVYSHERLCFLLVITQSFVI